MLGRYFEDELWSLFCCWCLVVAMKLILGRDSGLVWSRFLSLSFVEMVMFGWDFEVVWSRFVFELVIWPKEVTLVRWTQPSGPLCLWQCLHTFLFYLSNLWHLITWTNLVSPAMAGCVWYVCHLRCWLFFSQDKCGVYLKKVLMWWNITWATWNDIGNCRSN